MCPAKLVLHCHHRQVFNDETLGASPLTKTDHPLLNKNDQLDNQVLSLQNEMEVAC